jgi:prepilin-type N-terminal cleavage/methylation domain-containing protein
MVFRSDSDRCGEKGFTFIELIVVMAIIGMVFAIVIPYFGVVIRRGRVTSEARQVLVPLLKARLESIKRGNNVLVEISTDSSKTSYQTALVFVDTSSSGANKNVYDAGDTLIGTFPVAPSSDATLRLDDANVASPSTANATIDFIFTPFGSMDAATTSKAAYVSDRKNNVLQVSVPSATNGKPALTKQTSGTTYVAQPWTWY